MMEIDPELLERLIDVGNKALNDFYHERGCSCSLWPEKCATSAYSPGMWDTDAFAIALPALLGEFTEIVQHLLDDQALLASPEIQESLAQMRRGETVPALTLAEETPEAALDDLSARLTRLENLLEASDTLLVTAAGTSVALADRLVAQALEIDELKRELVRVKRSADVWASAAERARREKRSAVENNRAAVNEALAHAARLVLDAREHIRYGGASEYSERHSKLILGLQKPLEQEERGNG